MLPGEGGGKKKTDLGQERARSPCTARVWPEEGVKGSLLKSTKVQKYKSTKVGKVLSAEEQKYKSTSLPVLCPARGELGS